MNVLLAGASPSTLVKVEVALRLRWPSARVMAPIDMQSALEAVEGEGPEAVLFQPSAHGWPLDGFIQRLRAFSMVPLVVLEGADAGDLDEVRALEAGADDYLRASATIVELVAHIVALLRRIQRSEFPVDQPVFSGGLLVDPSTYEVHLHGQKVDLTFTEFRVLYFLAQNRGTVLSHATISQQIWGSEVDSSGLAKKYIQRIRRKLGDEPQSPRWVANVHGVGYRFLGAGGDGGQAHLGGLGRAATA